MNQGWAIALIALWIVMAIAMNVALANQAPTIPMDQLVDAFV